MSTHKKIVSLLNDEAFVKKLDEAGSKEKIKEIFAQKGVEPTDKELAELAVYIKREHGEELSESEEELLSGSDINKYVPKALPYLGYYYQTLLPGTGLNTFQ